MSCPVMNRDPSTPDGVSEFHYQDYLNIDKLLSLQQPKSEEHDEHLFIVVHQDFELWFRQIVVEVDSVRRLLCDSGQLATCVDRVRRVTNLIQHTNSTFSILETMAPLNFREFRDYLSTASGFQSQQFRIIENKLGVKENIRVKHQNESYKKAFKLRTDLLTDIDKSEEEATLFDEVEKWLESVYEKDGAGAAFISSYKHSVEAFIAKKSEETQQGTRDQYASLFDQAKHDKAVMLGERRLTLKAVQAAVMITMRKDDSQYALHHQLITLLVDVDTLLMRWRYLHRITVLKMLGVTQKGSAGTAGYGYLTTTTGERYYVFLDLSSLAALLLPRRLLLGSQDNKGDNDEVNSSDTENLDSITQTMNLMKIDIKKLI